MSRGDEKVNKKYRVGLNRFESRCFRVFGVLVFEHQSVAVLKERDKMRGDYLSDIGG